MKLYLKVNNTQKKFILSLLIIIIFASLLPCALIAQDEGNFAPTLTGISLNSGYTYDPSDDTFFFQISLFKLWDYDQIWFHDAPENLRFKIEGSIGGSYWDNDVRLIANAGMLAMVYIDRLATKSFRPYIEGGIGVIYTDYRVNNQAYRFNFNPQAGIGVEFNKKNHKNWFIALRAHHLSNGGLNGSNRGQNSVVFMLGQYF